MSTAGQRLLSPQARSAIQVCEPFLLTESNSKVSLFSRLRAVVSGDDYLDGEYDDELDYDAERTR